MSENNSNFLIKWCDYHDYLSKEFFDVCDDMDVLEIAAFTGHQTPAILTRKIKSLTLVEPSPGACINLKMKFPTAKIIQDDIFNVYKETVPADVVICFGLLYHLHNPFSLLENIVNQSSPKYIILDNINSRDIGTARENLNSPGERFVVDTKKKTIKTSIILPFEEYNRALLDLGYKNVKSIMDMTRFNISTKSDFWTGLWEKYE